jgi:hypothetical protein
MSDAGIGRPDLDFNRIFRACFWELWVLGPLERFHLHCLFELTAQEVVKRISGWGVKVLYSNQTPLPSQEENCNFLLSSSTVWSLFIKVSYVQRVIKGDIAVSSLSNSLAFPVSVFVLGRLVFVFTFATVVCGYLVVGPFCSCSVPCFSLSSGLRSR